MKKYVVDQKMLEILNMNFKSSFEWEFDVTFNGDDLEDVIVIETSSKEVIKFLEK